MKDFRLRNDTVLLLRNEPVDDIMEFAEGKRFCLYTEENQPVVTAAMKM